MSCVINSEIYNELFVSRYGDENMSCPMYKDFTRECAEKFNEIVNISNFDICDSDSYKKCPFYRNIYEPEKRCEYDEICMNDMTVRTIPFKELIKKADTYCFTENRVNCERYKLMKSGKTIPDGLLADGNKIELKT